MALLYRTHYNTSGAAEGSYTTSMVSRGTVTSEDFLSEAAEDSTVSKATIVAAAQALALQFRELLLRGYSVELPGVGKFRVSASGWGTYATAAELLAIPNSKAKRRVLFTPTTDLKAELESEDSTRDYGSLEDGVHETLSSYQTVLRAKGKLS